jgi:uncharacterized cupin superfamily protein
VSDRVSIWQDMWDSADEEGGARRLPRGDKLGATLYELQPGADSRYHFHHGSEELLVVLRGRPTLRTPDGERRLEEGEVVHFAVGPDGAHGIVNRTPQPVRYLMASTLVSPEVAEYPDTRQITAQARTPSQFGERLWTIHELPEPSSEP